jgi:hypothetical protein
MRCSRYVRSCTGGCPRIMEWPLLRCGGTVTTEAGQARRACFAKADRYELVNLVATDSSTQPIAFNNVYEPGRATKTAL